MIYVKWVQAVIGTAPGQVTLTSTPNGPLTMNADGTITVAAIQQQEVIHNLYNL
jgi:hypothetical protein